MAQPTPEKILAIIDDHDRAQKNNATKTSSFIYVSAWQLLEWSRIPLYQRFVLMV
ncbi:hypothetical protein HZ728_004298 [Escherichia coli]|nr:hypothetical protein [Escherichia coli]ELP7697864.1 hypothetical protein [Salmonella enterica]EFU2982305.1 hypothetical protein [Escherichia coli]HAU8043535.1 hypothetical protein [Escherichia coli]HAU8083314.1 hypothetical protein [Escherichia coli]